ncbi:MAG TPA: hypothetical protein VFW21_03570 [Mycobacterium sp.]|nr:hypothetical protein [Mycobacterium sp.]
MITHVGDAGAVEVARHQIATRATDGSTTRTFRRPRRALARTPRPMTSRGRVPGVGRDGAALWLTEAS